MKPSGGGVKITEIAEDLLDVLYKVGPVVTLSSQAESEVHRTAERSRLPDRLLGIAG